MDTILTPAKENKKIHPHKFALWIAMGSMSMMFAGLTSAYMVRESQGNWRYFTLPSLFTYSTFVIILSSITAHLAVKAFKKQEVSKFKKLIYATILLGLLFGLLQFAGFYQLLHTPQVIKINGQVLNDATSIHLDGNPSESFIYIISGLHLLHIFSGIIALVIVFWRTLRKEIKTFNSTGLEIVASYWHFVDILWVYLFIFFLVNQ